MKNLLCAVALAKEHSGSFPPAFTHLSATFPVAEIGVKPLKEKNLCNNLFGIRGV